MTARPPYVYLTLKEWTPCGDCGCSVYFQRVDHGPQDFSERWEGKKSLSFREGTPGKCPSQSQANSVCSYHNMSVLTFKCTMKILEEVPLTPRTCLLRGHAGHGNSTAMAPGDVRKGLRC